MNFYVYLGRMQPETVIIIVMSILLTISFIFVAYFLFKITLWLKQKNLKVQFNESYVRKSIYERLGDDENATRHYVYMRRKLTGG